MRNLPNLMTLSRIVLIPVMVIFFYLPFHWCRPMAAIIFSIAAITDWLDGYLARYMEVDSPLGAFLDPVADKLLVAFALVLLVADNHLPYLTIPAAIIIGREITISALREWMAEIGNRTSVAVGYLGKVKTLIQMVAIVMLLSVHHSYHPWVLYTGYLMLYIAALLTLWSMVIYLKASGMFRNGILVHS